MKKFSIICLAAAALLTACHTPMLIDGMQQTAPAVAADVAQQQPSGRQFRVGVTQMYPLKGGSRYAGPGYYVELRGDTLESYLPYFGQVYRSTYGRNENLNFTRRISSITTEKKKRGKTVINIDVRTSEDYYRYVLSFFENGKVDVEVCGNYCDNIRFDGELLE